MPAPRPTAISAGRRTPTAASAGSAPTSSRRCAPPSFEPTGITTGQRGEASPASEHLYGRRHGRKLRAGQQGLLDELLPQLAVTLGDSGPLDPKRLFDAPVDAAWLEVGFGGGEHLAAQAAAHPQVGVIGCEPFVNGVVSLLGHVARADLGNVRIWPDSAIPVLDALADGSIARAFVLFPDPWPKLRQHKRRFVARPNLDRLARVLADGAELRLASDDADYVRWMLFELLAHPAFEWLARRPSDWRERPADWPATRYEQKARKAGLSPSFLRFRRKPRRIV